MVKRTKSVVTVLVLLVVVLGLTIQVQHQRLTLAHLKKRVHAAGAVVVSAAVIQRNVPSGSAVFGNNTLRLTGSVVVKEIPPLGNAYILVIADDSSFADNVSVALDTFKTMGARSMAFLPQKVEIFSIDGAGQLTYLDSGSINYIEIR